MIREGFTLLNYDEMNAEERIAKETIHKLGDILVKVANGIVTEEEARQEIMELMNDEEAFEKAIKEFSRSELVRIIRILGG